VHDLVGGLAGVGVDGEGDRRLGADADRAGELDAEAGDGLPVAGWGSVSACVVVRVSVVPSA